MFNWRKYKSLSMLASGLVLGLLIGVGMMFGAAAATSGWLTAGSDEAVRDRLQQTLLHASATDSGKTFSMATGQVDSDIEGLFILDYLTGELQCFVLNNRSYQFAGWFKRNVIADLGADTTKEASYIMVTGTASFRGGAGGQARPAQCICYVADANTGNFAAYSFPWNANLANNMQAQASPMLLLGKGKARNVELRE